MAEPTPLRAPRSKLDEDMLKRTRILHSFLCQIVGNCDENRDPTFEEFKHALYQTYLFDPTANHGPPTPEQEAEFEAALAGHSDVASLSEELHRTMYEAFFPWVQSK